MFKNWGRAGGVAECGGRAAEFWPLHEWTYARPPHHPL
jgi:hypothetical protein